MHHPQVRSLLIKLRLIECQRGYCQFKIFPVFCNFVIEQESHPEGLCIKIRGHFMAPYFYTRPAGLEPAAYGLEIRKPPPVLLGESALSTTPKYHK